MIKNVVFDVGDVLMRFPSRVVAESLTENEADALALYREVFCHPDWIRIDRGTPEAEALDSMCARLPARLRDAARQAMACWDRWLEPVAQTNALAQELHELGLRVYLLSNFPPRFQEVRERIPCWSVVEGAVVSFEEGLLKPDPEIYRRLCQRYGLAPAECFFIDDSPLNVEAAWWCGWQGAPFRQDGAELRSALRAAGVPVAAQ